MLEIYWKHTLRRTGKGMREAVYRRWRSNVRGCFHMSYRRWHAILKVSLHLRQGNEPHMPWSKSDAAYGVVLLVWWGAA